MDAFRRFKVGHHFWSNRCAIGSNILKQRELDGKPWYHLDIKEFELLVPWAKQFKKLTQKDIRVFSGGYVYENGQKYRKEHMNDFQIFVSSSQIDCGKWSRQCKKIESKIQQHRRNGNSIAAVRLERKLRALDKAASSRCPDSMILIKCEYINTRYSRGETSNRNKKYTVFIGFDLKTMETDDAAGLLIDTDSEETDDMMSESITSNTSSTTSITQSPVHSVQTQSLHSSSISLSLNVLPTIDTPSQSQSQSTLDYSVPSQSPTPLNVSLSLNVLPTIDSQSTLDYSIPSQSNSSSSSTNSNLNAMECLQIDNMNFINDESNNYFNIGFTNEGNTCYLNSILQMIYRMKGLRYEILHTNWPLSSFLCRLKRLFQSMQYTNNRSVSTGHIVNYLRNIFSNMEWCIQDDAVFRYKEYIMDRIMAELKTYSDVNDRIYNMDSQLHILIDPTTFYNGFPLSRFENNDGMIAYDRELSIDVFVPQNYRESITLLSGVENYFFEVCN